MLPVGAFTAGAIFVILWWLALFVVLPFGVRPLSDGPEVAKGSEPGAPIKPMLAQKALWATGLAAFFWAVTMVVIAADPLSIRG
jgi:predicted secreted protein